MRVYYFGPEGSFTGEAAVQRFGQRSEFIPVDEVIKVISAVQEDSSAVGVVPIENSARGAVYDAVDRIMRDDFNATGLRILEELTKPIVLSLLANSQFPGSRKVRRTYSNPSGAKSKTSFLNVEEKKWIRRIYSHPYPLALCRDWVRTHIPGARLVEKSSTSEAARAAARDSRGAAIANRRAARIYHLTLVIREIGDLGPNITNFFVIGRKEGHPTGSDKTGIVFSLEHRPGSLYRALGVLARNKINMTRIISRPKPETVGEYHFFVEVEGHRKDPKLAGTLVKLKRLTLSLTVVGSYPRIRLN